MSSFRLTSPRLPAGTSVKVHRRIGEEPRSRAGLPPLDTPVATVTVGADGSILITGLGTNTPYWAVGLVGSEYHWVPFMTAPAPTIEDLESTDLLDSATLARLTDLPLSGSKLWTPPSVANGAFTSTTVTVTGAVVANGEADVAVASFGITTAGCFLYAEVVSANTVRVTLYNFSGSLQSIGQAVLLAKVFKQ